MKLTKLETRSFALAELNTYDLKGLSINTERALEELEQELVEDLKDLNSHNTKSTRCDYFKLQDTSPEDYRERVLKLDDQRSIIFGIRNMGGDKEIPFIKIMANFEINSKETALSIYNLIRNEFIVFKPLYLSFYSKSKVSADFFGAVHMVIKTKDVIASTPWPAEEKIKFISIADSSYYEWYKEEYAQFHTDVPELKKRVPINGEDAMEDSLEQGLLKFIEFEGERIGLISGERSEFLGHTGIYFNEIYISKKWKGKGLAKAVQRKFISLFAQDLELSWGTIDSSNLPSYKTAYSNGRRPIRYECFVDLR